MRSLRLEKVLVAVAFVAAAMVTGPLAHAADAPAGTTGAGGGNASSGNPGPATSTGAGSTGATVAPASDANAKDAKKDEKPETPIFDVNVDFVGGAAKTAEVTGVIPPGTTAGINGQTVQGTASVTNYSFLLSAGMNVTDCVSLGMRLPLEGGTLFANPTRQTGGVGNFELSGGGTITLSSLVNLGLSLALTLPTAGGTQLPPNGAVPVVQGAIDQSGYDRYSVQRAISMSRGYEDDELFQVNHLGINPKAALAIGTAGKWNVTPWIKLDDLIATNKSYSYIGELLFGLNLGAFIVPQVEPVVKIWANAPLTGADWSGAVAVVEPQVRFHFGDISPYVGAILPIAGPISNPYAWGVRVGLGARF